MELTDIYATGGKVMLQAASISLAVKQQLQHSEFNGRVLNTHNAACNLVDESENIITLTAPSIGNGPFSIVVDAPFDELGANDPAHATASQITVAKLTITLDGAISWDPRPDWNQLRAVREKVTSGFAAFDDWASSAIWGGLAHITGADQFTEGKPTFMARLGRGREAYRRLIVEGLGAENHDSLADGARLLGGLGPGDTPAGDDFLIGVMAAVWLLGEEEDAAAIAEAAAPRTSLLSAAYLRAAGRGEFFAPWHDLLQALAVGDPLQVEKTAMAMESFGASSGADALDGFILAGRRLLNLDAITPNSEELE